MPTVAERARSLSQHQPRVPCATGAFLQSLTVRERDEINEAFDDDTITVPAMMSVLADLYPTMCPLTDGQIRRHVRGRNGLKYGCTCG